MSFLRITKSPLAWIAFACAFAFGAGMTLLGAQKTVAIQPQARPLREFAEKLEKEYAWRITYEEAPLEFEGDLADASGGRKEARATPFIASFEEPTDIKDITNKHKLLQKVVSQYSGTQKMIVLNNGDYSHIVPSHVKGADGGLKPFEPLLSTRVSLDPAQRSLFEAVTSILLQVARTRNISLGLGTAPTNLFLRTQQLTYAENEEARDVLMRLFEDANGARILTGVSAIRFTWELMCDPSYHGYFFNVHNVDSIDGPAPGPNSVPKHQAP